MKILFNIYHLFGKFILKMLTVFFSMNQKYFYNNEYKKVERHKLLLLVLNTYINEITPIFTQKNRNYIETIENENLIVYLSRNNYSIKFVFKDEESIVYPPNYFGQDYPVPKKIEHPDIYIAKLEKANIIGSSSLIVHNNIGLINNSSYDNNTKVDFHSNSSVLFSNSNKISHYFVDKSKPAIDKGIMLNGLFSFNYYHWIIEYLPKLLIIDNTNDYDTFPLLVDRDIFYISQLYEALELLNLKKRKIIPLDSSSKYFINKLVIPSSVNYLISNIKKGYEYSSFDCILRRDTLLDLRNHFLKRLEIQPKLEKKIFISRKNTSRRCFNESEIFEIFKKYGFETVYPEKLSFIE